MMRRRSVIAVATALLVGVVARRSLARSKQVAADAVIDDAVFWSIVEGTLIHEANTDDQSEALFVALSALSTDQVVAFTDAFARQMLKACTWDLWAVDYIAHGGASDDGFEYFRRWLISKGRQAFERVLAQPDDLASILAPDSRGVLEYEEFATVAWDVWAEKTGKSPEDIPMTADTMAAMDAEPRGEPFAEDPAALAARFPKTWARFGQHPLT